MAVAERHSNTASDPGVASYTERLWVPIGWWVLGTLFALSLLAAVFFYLGPAVGIGIGAGVMVVIAVMFLSYGRERLRVTEDRLWAGQANVEWRYVADVQALDQPATRLRRGRDADARAFLVLRPYLHRAVEVTLADDQDPTPYWLISTRAPERLEQAIRERLSGSAPDRGEIR